LGTDPDQLDLLIEVDLRGVSNTAVAADPAMLDGRDPSGCRFVAVASAAATHGLFHSAGYSAAKHAVVGLVKGFAANAVASAAGRGACDVSAMQRTARCPRPLASSPPVE
jgi:NAD(P)-dependent dehydrogenase (short-subunit alcohol dehydrogenase family)